MRKPWPSPPALAPTSSARSAFDANYVPTQNLLMARMAAVVGAQQALSERQAGAVYALRQSLVDLAAVSEALAGDMRSGSR